MKFVATSLSFFLGLGMVVGSPLGDSDGHALARRSYNTGYANQLTDGTACRAVTVLWARGTGQQGNIGVSTDVGPMFLDDLAAKVGTNNLAAQGVNYSASVSGFEQGGDPAGSTLLANLATQAYTQCPNTKLVLSGYSQGGQLVHNAAKSISSKITNFVAAVLIFGDPDNGDAVGSIPSSKVHIICHATDGICLGWGIITGAHLNYQDDAGDAAAWVATALGY